MTRCSNWDNPVRLCAYCPEFDEEHDCTRLGGNMFQRINVWTTDKLSDMVISLLDIKKIDCLYAEDGVALIIRRRNPKRARILHDLLWYLKDHMPEYLSIKVEDDFTDFTSTAYYIGRR